MFEDKTVYDSMFTLMLKYCYYLMLKPKGAVRLVEAVSSLIISHLQHVQFLGRRHPR